MVKRPAQTEMRGPIQLTADMSRLANPVVRLYLCADRSA
jgi:hypothetical protein